MSKIDDGGEAFPWQVDVHDPINGGLSIRDYFAGQAIPHVSKHFDRLPATASKLASDCYAIADAMLAARKAGA